MLSLAISNFILTFFVRIIKLFINLLIEFIYKILKKINRPRTYYHFLFTWFLQDEGPGNVSCVMYKTLFYILPFYLFNKLAQYTYILIRGLYVVGGFVVTVVVGGKFIVSVVITVIGDILKDFKFNFLQSLD